MFFLHVLAQARHVAVSLPTVIKRAHPISLIFGSVSHLVLLEVRAGVEPFPAILAHEELQPCVDALVAGQVRFVRKSLSASVFVAHIGL